MTDKLKYKRYRVMHIPLNLFEGDGTTVKIAFKYYSKSPEDNEIFAKYADLEIKSISDAITFYANAFNCHVISVSYADNYYCVTFLND